MTDGTPGKNESMHPRKGRGIRSLAGGTGLGLAIVQSIMTLHGGTAEIASQLGRGTTVTLRIHSTAM